ncbi:nucleoside triphosphate hydrolase [Lichenihabitans sp. Uapishka_5]|uniref:nucleoside triphosphate hydrolase n=1 Tax=Lichenihabitans sp. Uapishka_5 TaxID=3037302 RepID=UPI0029E81C2E|nr:nucleoside triphosphate hydrolase [Lichenihabitans sp. Uapishka_5]MDX7949586.1 nucleoside triphosphate hydrolase [Lichenihabitans sp. Uapishka_5]
MNTSRPVTFEVLVQMAAEEGPERRIIAIAGAPGSGKSTLAERLVAQLDATGPGSAAVLPMDGYHLDDAVLIARGLRARKGAPETFDVAGFGHMLERLRRNQEDEIAVPVFDRALEIARAGGRMIPRTVRTLVVEGNYLLLDRAPWSALRVHFDHTVMVSVPEAELRRRLTERWLGYGMTGAALEAKLEENDLPNGRLIVKGSIAPDFILTQDGINVGG